MVDTSVQPVYMLYMSALPDSDPISAKNSSYYIITRTRYHPSVSIGNAHPIPSDCPRTGASSSRMVHVYARRVWDSGTRCTEDLVAASCGTGGETGGTGEDLGAMYQILYERSASAERPGRTGWETIGRVTGYNTQKGRGSQSEGGKEVRRARKAA